MPKSLESLVSFSAGEWSPGLAARVDQQKYRSACVQQRNMICLKTGPAGRRPGTLHIAQAKLGSAYAVRQVDFQYSINTTFAFEFGHHYVRFYSNRAQVTLSSAPTWVSMTTYLPGAFVEDPGDSNNIYFCLNKVTSATQPHSDGANWLKQTILEVPTPYDATIGAGKPWDTDIFGLQFCVINDVVYICHKDYPRAKLIRFSDTDWAYQVVQDLIPPLLDQNATDTTIAASSTNNIGTPGTIAAINVTNGGSGYSSPPTIGFTGGGGGTGLAATAVVGGVLLSVNVNSGGSGYSFPPNVIFTGGGGTGATAYAVVSGGQIIKIVVTNGGSGYTSAPAVSFLYSPGTGANATAVIAGSQLVSITITNPGTGYTSTPGVTITGGGGTGAAAVAVLAGIVKLTASAPPWQTGVYYDLLNSVLQGGVIYQCSAPHVSSVFANDLANGNWTATPIFQAGHVGSKWELAYRRGSSYVEYDATSAAAGFVNGFSQSIMAFGDCTVRTYGVWVADAHLQVSTNGGVTWQTIRTYTSRSDANYIDAVTAPVAALYRLQIVNASAPPTPGTTIPRIVFQCSDSFLYGIVQIASVTDDYDATATVITQLAAGDAWVSGKAYNANDRTSYNGINYLCITAVTGSTAPPADSAHWLADGWPTIYWSEGAWSDVRGYPAAITAWGQRVWCGFTEYQPQRVWGTKLDDIENWDLGDQTLATDGVAFDLDAVGCGAILWLQSQDALFVGFSLAEWVLAASDGSSAVTSTNVTAHRQSQFGSNQNLPALVVGDALIFAQRQGVSLRQMLYSIVTQKYMSQDLTALSDQILNGGAKQMSYQKIGQKNGFVWAVTANGELACMTYELDQEVFGWHRHVTGLGLDFGFESVCCLQGKGADDDEVWVVVNRTVGGQQVRSIELLDPTNWQNLVLQPGQTPGTGPDKNKANHVDAGVTYLNPGSNIFGGLGHLIGRTVVAAINAMDYGTAVVDVSGTATFPSFNPADFTGDVTAHVGLPFTSTLQPMNLDVDVHTGATAGVVKKVTGVTLNLLNTLALKVTDGIPKKVTFAEDLVAGRTYTIMSVGTTDFTAVGAQCNIVGGTFVATGAGTGTGVCGSEYRVNELVFRQTDDGFEEVQLYTGYYDVRDFGGDYAYTIPIIMFTDGPLPLTVLGVAVAYNLSGKP